MTAFQRGSTVILSWPPPTQHKKNSATFDVDRVDIYRLIEERSQEPVLDPDDYQSVASVIGFLDRDTIQDQIKTFGRLGFTDRVDLSRAADAAKIRFRYAVRFVNARGQEAAFSNTVEIDPSAAVANPPHDLKVAGEAQGEIRLEWKEPQTNVDGGRPVNVVGYNVYRRNIRAGAEYELLNRDPITETTFTDAKFRYLAHYNYVVRALSRGRTGLIESTDSNLLENFRPVDKFKPSVPNPVSIASANKVVSLFWPSNPEPDVVGYNVYRSESPEAGPNDWVKMTPEPITTVTFHDEKVVVGTRYYYRVTAVDKFKNESDPSAAVSETANP
ncbi:MAG TPA: fibronectin type III domain-containing protein [Blastocatellia bacterium]|nr:fibronectin type III domain-containing protein [Blastocatellia bacterium]